MSLDYSFDPGADAIAGNASPSVYDSLTGGLFANFQDPFSATDTGTVNNSTTGTGTASPAGTITPPTGGSSFSPPSWLQAITGLSTAVGNAYTSLSPVIGGKPAPGPGTAGQAKPGATTLSFGGTAITASTLIIGALALVVLFFFLKKK